MADRRWLAALVMLGACDKDGGPNAGGTFHLEWAFFPETGRTCGDVGIAQVEASIKPFDGLPTSARFPCTDAAGDTGDFPLDKSSDVMRRARRVVIGVRQNNVVTLFVRRRFD